MKKTEKIEVRVSHEEKARLSGIAERRGVSVSELIREQMAEDIGTLPRVPKWPGYAAVAAGALALAALSLSVLSKVQPTGSLRPAAVIHVYGQTYQAAFGRVLPNAIGEAFEETLGLEDGKSVAVRGEIVSVKGDVTTLHVTACEAVSACDTPIEFVLSASTAIRSASMAERHLKLPAVEDASLTIKLRGHAMHMYDYNSSGSNS